MKNFTFTEALAAMIKSYLDSAPIIAMNFVEGTHTKRAVIAALEDQVWKLRQEAVKEERVAT